MLRRFWRKWIWLHDIDCNSLMLPTPKFFSKNDPLWFGYGLSVSPKGSCAGRLVCHFCVIGRPQVFTKWALAEGEQVLRAPLRDAINRPLTGRDLFFPVGCYKASPLHDRDPSSGKVPCLCLRQVDTTREALFICYWHPGWTLKPSDWEPSKPLFLIKSLATGVLF